MSERARELASKIKRASSAVSSAADHLGRALAENEPEVTSIDWHVALISRELGVCRRLADEIARETGTERRMSRRTPTQGATR